ncbi:MAG: acetolactate decarboxylase [Candidatus Omnitrophota bacterium]
MRNFRKTTQPIFVLFLILVLISIFLWQLSRENNRDILYQVSMIGALMKGGYDTAADIKTLKSHGDFGIGTFDALDGEMVALAGNFYQVRSDGSVHVVLDAAKTPFALVTFFDVDRKTVLDKPLDLENMKKFIDGLLPTKNIPYAIKIEGRFDHVKTRSVPRQEKPYRGLNEAVNEQSVFELSNVEGVVVGFIIPGYMQGLHPCGYHLHFLSADRRFGGHLLEAKLARGVVSIDDTYQYHVTLPKNNQFSQLDLSVTDAAAVEK